MHAIDREGIAKNLVGDGSRVLHTNCFPSQFGCTDEGAPRYKYDPAQAKKLLAEAGFPNGFEIEIVAYRERHQTEAMINNLHAVGIKAKLQFPAVRGDARVDPRQQGAADPPDLGLVLRQRRVGLHAQLLRLRRRGHHARSGGAGPARSRATTRSIPRRARRPTRQALTLIAERAYAVPLWSLPVFYVADQGPVVQGLSGRAAALLGDDLEVGDRRDREWVDAACSPMTRFEATVGLWRVPAPRRWLVLDRIAFLLLRAVGRSRDSPSPARARRRWTSS